MLKLKYSRKTFYIAPEDDRAIETIKEKYGLSTASDVIRFSVRLIAENPMVQLPKKKGKIT